MTSGIATMTFGDVAASLGIKSSTRKGWPCPACQSPSGLREADHHLTATCGTCGIVFDRITYIAARQNLSGLAALDRLLMMDRARHTLAARMQSQRTSP